MAGFVQDQPGRGSVQNIFDDGRCLLRFCALHQQIRHKTKAINLAVRMVKRDTNLFAAAFIRQHALQPVFVHHLSGLSCPQLK